MASLHTIHCLELLLLEEQGEEYSVAALAKRWRVTRRTVFRYKATVRKVKNSFSLHEAHANGTNGYAGSVKVIADER
jgi:hypothetical protein